MADHYSISMQQITHNFIPAVLSAHSGKLLSWAPELPAVVNTATLRCAGTMSGSVQDAQGEKKTNKKQTAPLLWCAVVACMWRRDENSGNELRLCQNQPSWICGWGEGQARRRIIEVRTRLQISPESLAYCLVSSLLVQPTWCPDLSASGFSHQRPLLGESNWKSDPSLYFKTSHPECIPKSDNIRV